MNTKVKKTTSPLRSKFPAAAFLLLVASLVVSCSAKIDAKQKHGKKLAGCLEEKQATEEEAKAKCPEHLDDLIDEFLLKGEKVSVGLGDSSREKHVIVPPAFTSDPWHTGMIRWPFRFGFNSREEGSPLLKDPTLPAQLNSRGRRSDG